MWISFNQEQMYKYTIRIQPTKLKMNLQNIYQNQHLEESSSSLQWSLICTLGTIATYMQIYLTDDTFKFCKIPLWYLRFYVCIHTLSALALSNLWSSCPKPWIMHPMSTIFNPKQRWSQKKKRKKEGKKITSLIIYTFHCTLHWRCQQWVMMLLLLMHLNRWKKVWQKFFMDIYQYKEDLTSKGTKKSSIR